MNLTDEQVAAISSRGKTIVSASAGSGKTFVMIRKLVEAIEGGTDLDNVLAVTFTKKAAAQMKEKLRAALIERLSGADAKKRAAIKVQLSKISSADISTIHSFCARLLRTYFYSVGIDGTFDIISADDSAAKEYKQRALENMFERYYEEDEPDFKLLLKCYRKKRGDAFLKNLILSAYEKLRITADYMRLLNSVDELYTLKGFNSVCGEIQRLADEGYKKLRLAVKQFAGTFISPRKEYGQILDEMVCTLENSVGKSIFAPMTPLTVTKKPMDKTPEEKEQGESFKKFRESINSAYKSYTSDIEDEDTELERFFESGETAKAFARILKDFDGEYTQIKREENKLDYNDLEHLTLELLRNDEVRKEINGKYTCVFVDEYQDVNPVQEEIISRVGGENVFLVGDVKQAIYGFRGSKSLFFAEKFERLQGNDGNALRLSNNFRSSDGVLDFVNSVFSQAMTSDSCGFDYSRGSIMRRGGGYPEGYGSAEIHVFGKDEEEKTQPEVYSVKQDEKKASHTREGLAVLEVVKRELQSKYFDLKTGEERDVQPGDICILTRKRSKSAEGIARALTDAGYCVSGAQEADILSKPEVRQMLDILSYIDDTQQDVPLAGALLSPLGGLTCNELATIRIAAKGRGKQPFRLCCEQYAKGDNEIAAKLRLFYARADRLRDIAEVLTAAEVIDKIAEGVGLEAIYSGGNGEKLKNLRRLAAEGENMSVSAFLAKIKGGTQIAAPGAASSDSIKIMTMHASKGLEFPVVIIADICAGFKGRVQSELPFDEKYGFAPKCFDSENMLTYETLLRRLIARTNGREELKNELNLFYVACTRAMCRLHVMAQEITPYDPLSASEAARYSELFDISAYPHSQTEFCETEFKTAVNAVIMGEPDPHLKGSLESTFMRPYAHAESVNLPVKSSASAILKLAEEDGCFKAHKLFSGEGETGTERGTAYHRFLELCDFGVRGGEGISAELDGFVKEGKMSAEQRELLNIEELKEILAMPVFESVKGAQLMREREFLCRLPANEIFETTADDPVLIQGALDLLVLNRDGYHIIDYKYSKKSDEQLAASYAKQLALYKKAVAVITGAKPENIKTTLVNIFNKRQIQL